MLVLSRKRDQSIIIDGNIRITVVGIQGNQVRLGIEAPNSVSIFREELRDRAEGVERPTIETTGLGLSSRMSATRPGSAIR
jgi:carbon storage regulator